MKLNEFKQELQSLNMQDLQDKLNATRRELFSLRLNASTAHVKDYSQYKKLKKNVARLLTYIGQK